MGRLPILQPSDEDPRLRQRDPKHPVESHEEGCPGSWYRSAFALSCTKYERMITDSGISENLFQSRSEDRLLLEACSYLEGQRMRSRNYDLQQQANKD